jgi:hypothetical protein
MNYPTIGKVLSNYEKISRMKIRLEDLIRHTKVLSEQLCEQTLYENESVLPAGDPAETALTLASEAILIYEKLS